MNIEIELSSNFGGFKYGSPVWSDERMSSFVQSVENAIQELEIRLDDIETRMNEIVSTLFIDAEGNTLGELFDEGEPPEGYEALYDEWSTLRHEACDIENNRLPAGERIKRTFKKLSEDLDLLVFDDTI